MSVEGNALQSLKSCMDPNAMVYVFSDGSTIAMDRDWMFAQNTYVDGNGITQIIPNEYETVVSPACINSFPVNVLYKTAQTRSKGARAISFGGISDAIAIDAGKLKSTFTLSGYFSVPTGFTGNGALFTAYYGPNSGSILWSITVDKVTGYMNFNWLDRNTGWTSCAIYDPTNLSTPRINVCDGGFHFLEIIFASSGITIAFDKFMIPAATNATIPGTLDLRNYVQSTRNLWIGGTQAGQFTQMSLDNLRYFNYDLPTSSAANIQNDPRMVFSPAPIVQLRYDDYTANLLEVSGNNTFFESFGNPSLSIAPNIRNIWIDYTRAMKSNPNLGDILVRLNDPNQFAFANQYEVDDLSILPSVLYTDAIGGTFKINPQDGLSLESTGFVAIDEADASKVLITQSNRNYPNMIFPNHFATDLSVTSKDCSFNWDDVFVWANGYFIPTLNDSTNQVTITVAPNANHFKLNLPLDGVTPIFSGNITWSSSNTVAATVDHLGNVSALNFGITTISAVDALGHEAFCIVYVQSNGTLTPPVSLNMNTNRFYLVDAISYLNTMKNEQGNVDGNPPSMTQLHLSDAPIPTCTVTENPLYDVYKYDFQIRLFAWKNVRFSQWLNSNTIEYEDLNLAVPISQVGSAKGIPNAMSINVMPNSDFVNTGAWSFVKSNAAAQTVALTTAPTIFPSGYGSILKLHQSTGTNNGYYDDYSSSKFDVKSGYPMLFSVYLKAFQCQGTASVKFYATSAATTVLEEVPFADVDDYDNNGSYNWINPLTSTAYPATDIRGFNRVKAEIIVPVGAKYAVFCVRKYETTVAPQGSPVRTTSDLVVLAAMAQYNTDNLSIFRDWVPYIVSTTYTWVKYTNSPIAVPGNIVMLDTPYGVTGVGYAYNKTTDVMSNQPTDYTWFNYTNSRISIPTAVSFNVPIHFDAHFIIADGRILNSREYNIDPTNPSKIQLNYLLNDAEEYYQKALLHYRTYAQGIAAGGNPSLNDYPIWNSNVAVGQESLPAYEATMKKYAYISYQLVNIVSKDGTDLRIIRKPAALVDFPLKNEITFDEIEINDLIIIDGYFIPYEWIHNATVKLPTSNRTFDYLNGRRLSDCEIYRLQLAKG